METIEGMLRQILATHTGPDVQPRAAAVPNQNVGYAQARDEQFEGDDLNEGENFVEERPRSMSTDDGDGNQGEDPEWES